ncbi:hypothetical protein Fmac_024028 [Flemingia macrophylla]|uniref:DUF4220 domain-containing protein n=1 Tax=Flemingia macrophylla TaxID=520843 RepID=A0ABD1LN71_9FABA
MVFGNHRKYKTSSFLKGSMWLAYLSADLVATFALGILSKDIKNPSNDPNFKIMAIWAPFLLVHLGGPDTITAYSLEDNELWQRHLLGLIQQLIAAVYVVCTSWNSNIVNYVTLPVLVTGLIKYGERTLSLWLGSTNKFRKSILPPPDPGPNYAKFMDDCTARKDQGYKVELKIEESTSLLQNNSTSTVPAAPPLNSGFYFLKIFEGLFADLILGIQEQRESRRIFLTYKTWKPAFKVVEVELGLMYDKLYTKAVVAYSLPGLILKLVTFICTLSAFITFCWLIDEPYKDSDQLITLVLFVGAIFLEMYAIIVLLSSSWARFWLSENKINWKLNFDFDFLTFLQKRSNKLFHPARWSNLISQYNLLDFCLKVEPAKRIKPQIFQPIYHQILSMLYHEKPKTVTAELKDVIFKQLLKKSKKAENMEECKKLCAHRGGQVLVKQKCDSINWSTKVEFDQSLLLWHIATDLCYYSDGNCADIKDGQTSKGLSDYMLHLLVNCPFMLPSGIGEIRYVDTCAEVSELLQERKYISQRDQACQVIRRVSVDEKFGPSKVKGDRSKSVLFEALRLAKSIESLATEKNWPKEKKWKMISHVWVEMLCHAASRCRGFHHAKQLSQGGELITHVWLLMAHFGISEQFQILEGHARAKLVVR